MAKVLVLMSGGVDSSTAAALLVKQGYEVGGVYLKLWEGSKDSPSAEGLSLLGDPCWAQEMRDAARVAAHLDIPFQVWDVTAEYKARVLENFYSEYAAGRTPNPDVLCNSEIKFGVGLEKALAAGFDCVATGHYARVHNPPPLSLILREGESAQFPPLKVRGGKEGLWAAVDKNKDQSYFLWRLTQEQLEHVMFPIGDYTKPQVRAMAKEFGLHNWNKKDSQGVCFLGKIELREFLYRAPLLASPLRGEENRSFPLLVEEGLGVVRRPGPIVDVHGQLLGFHDGLAHFTIGQRQGTKLGGTGPYFVVEKDMASNTLIVVHEGEEVQYRTAECTVRDINWIDPLTSALSHEGRGRMGKFPSLDGRGKGRVMGRARYHAPLTPVSVHFHTLAYESACRVVFHEPARAVAPGQSIVFYDGERVIGGGVILNVKLCNEIDVFNSPKLQFTNSPNKIPNVKFNI